MTFTRILLLCLIAFPAFSQSGIPYIQNYTKNSYRAAARNWAVSLSAEGHIYIGNTNGLLCFNGAEWELSVLPDGKMVRSVMCYGDQRIYTGSFEEFGYFERDRFGRLYYVSLSDSLRGFSFHNDEIWNIVSYKGKIYFRSFSTYFVYDGRQVRAFSIPHTLTYLTYTGGDYMYAHLLGNGFYRFNGENFENLLTEDQLNGDVVVGVEPFRGKSLLLFTSKSGLFVYDGNSCSVWENEVNAALKKAVVNRVTMTKDSVYVVGTISEGIFAVSKDGRLLWKVDMKHGLENNTVLSLVCDNDNNIWAALDNGVSYIRSNSRLRFINTFDKPVGYVYSAALQDNYLYLATNQGLFYLRGENPDAKVEWVSGMAGQAWDLTSVDGQLLCGHNEGTFEISGVKAKKISAVNGATCFRKGVIHGQEILLQSSYTYLVVYKRDASGKWTFSHTIDGFMHPVRTLEIDGQGTIWAEHFYRGLYGVRLSPDLKKAEKIRFFESLNPAERNRIVHLFKIRGRIVFSDNASFYTFDDLTDSILSFDSMNKQFPENRNIHRAIPVNDDIYWLVQANEFVLVNFENKQPSVIQRIPFSLLYNSLPDGDENIIPLNDKQFIFCMDNGIAVLDNNRKIYEAQWIKRLKLEKIETRDNQKHARLLPIRPNKMPEVDYTFNNFVFYVSYPAFSGEDFRYEFRLDPVDKGWSEPSQRFVKEYARLYPGKYTLHIKVVDNLGRELDTHNYRFKVNPPFYASTWAYIFYTLLGFFLIFLIYFLVDRRIAKNKRKIKREQEELRRKESEKQEREIMRLQNEKLEADLTFKSKELASSTLSIIKKNEMLAELRRELTEQKEKMASQYPDRYYEKLIRLIDSNVSSKDDWLIFQSNFDRIHENFFRNLKMQYPDLTSTDLKFCALLRLNLNTKEIANLMNISIKGVEVGRYRLRKKLGLPSDVSLVDFMIKVK